MFLNAVNEILVFSLWKSGRYFMYHQVENSESQQDPHNAFHVVFMDLTTNSKFCCILHQQIRFCNWGREVVLCTVITHVCIYIHTHTHTGGHEWVWIPLQIKFLYSVGADWLEIFTLNWKHWLKVEWIGLCVKGLICTVNRLYWWEKAKNFGNIFGPQ